MFACFSQLPSDVVTLVLSFVPISDLKKVVTVFANDDHVMESLAVMPINEEIKFESLWVCKYNNNLSTLTLDELHNHKHLSAKESFENVLHKTNRNMCHSAFFQSYNVKYLTNITLISVRFLSAEKSFFHDVADNCPNLTTFEVRRPNIKVYCLPFTADTAKYLLQKCNKLQSLAIGDRFVLKIDTSVGTKEVLIKCTQLWIGRPNQLALFLPVVENCTKLTLQLASFDESFQLVDAVAMHNPRLRHFEMKDPLDDTGVVPGFVQTARLTELCPLLTELTLACLNDWEFWATTSLHGNLKCLNVYKGDLDRIQPQPVTAILHLNPSIEVLRLQQPYDVLLERDVRDYIEEVHQQTGRVIQLTWIL